MELFLQIIKFIYKRKQYLLIPIIIFGLFLAAVFYIGGTVVSPFVYAIF
tara:strand:+ start:181 stop:327 length:147 start_codon:yes stop_codon:yes gene_type:complete